MIFHYYYFWNFKTGRQKSQGFTSFIALIHFCFLIQAIITLIILSIFEILIFLHKKAGNGFISISRPNRTLIKNYHPYSIVGKNKTISGKEVKINKAII